MQTFYEKVINNLKLFSFKDKISNLGLDFRPIDNIPPTIIKMAATIVTDCKRNKPYSVKKFIIYLYNN